MRRLGYTIVELMVTIVIVTILTATVGVFLVKLLSFQEYEREEAFVRERLADICGAYADALSIGSAISISTNQKLIVKYRSETGGVSLETGTVTHVAYLLSSLNPENNTVSLNAYGIDKGISRLSRVASGDAALLPMAGDIVNCTITPLVLSGQPKTMADADFENFQTTDAALAYLEVTAQYRIRNDKGEIETRMPRAGRVVRLWNWEEPKN